MTLKGSYVALQMSQALRDTHIDLASDHRRRGVLEKGGQGQFGPGLGSKRFEFSIPSEKLSLGWFGDLTYRLRDVHLRSFEATATDREFLLTGYFDGAGPQFVGSHSMLGHVVPGVYMQNIRVMIWLTPSVDASGRLSYDSTRTRLTSRINTQGLTFTVSGHRVDLVDAMTGYHQRLADLVARKLRETLDDPEHKAALCGYINQALQEKAAKFGSVLKRIRVDGTDLTVTLAPRT